MTKKLILLAVFVCLRCVYAFGHGSCEAHVADFYDVFGFEYNDSLSAWMRHLSSNVIDQYNGEGEYVIDGEVRVMGFYDYLKAKYEPFKCKHRVLFHWGYNSLPWTDYLQEKVEGYGWDSLKISEFKRELITEQKRRNGKANAMTEDVFGFAHGGKEARLARAIVSIAYDVHLIGDYTPDNSDMDGLCTFESVIGDLINNLRVIDNSGTKTLVKQIQSVSRTDDDVQIRAQEIMYLLKENLRIILAKHNDSRISGRITKEKYVRPVVSQENEQENEDLLSIPQENAEESEDDGLPWGYILGGLALLVVIVILLIRR